MDEILQGCRSGLRLMIKRPGFVAVVVATLTLGIGATTAVYSVLDAVLLRRLPFPQAERLVVMHETLPDAGDAGTGYNTFVHWRERCRSFQGVAAVNAFEANLESGPQPERIAGASVSADYLGVMGLAPLEGRAFQPDDFRPGSPKVMLISQGLRRRRLGDEPLNGQTLRLDGQIRTVVGVLPAGYSNETIGWRDFWLPMVIENEAEARSWRWRYLDVIALLKPGVSTEQARSDIRSVSRGLEEEFPQVNQNYGADLHSLHYEVAGEARPMLLILMGAVGLVLLIACINVSSLLLSRTLERERETAIRKALGASSGGLFLHVMSECALLGLLGGLLGLLAARLCVPVLVRLGPADLPRLDEAAVDVRVLGFCLIISLGALLAFGALPALGSTRGSVADRLKEHSTQACSAPSSGRLRRLLTTAQIAAAMILLVGSGLMLQSVRNLLRVDPGFSARNVLTFSVSLPMAHYPRAADRLGFHRRLVERLRSLPGVESAAAVSSPPLRIEAQWMVFVEGRPEPEAGHEPFVPAKLVSPGYFRAMGIPLQQGRTLTDQEAWEKGGAVLINRSMAERFWPGENPLGKRIKHYREKDWMTVVGVVGDVVQESLDKAPVAQSYMAYAELPYRGKYYLLRAESDPLGLVDAVSREVRRLDPSLPLSDVRLAERILDQKMEQPRFALHLLGAFSLLALLLAMVGIYGVLAHTVVQRRSEIGLRLALGARESGVLRLILTQTLRLTAAGIVLGWIGAAALTRWMEGLLFEVSPWDPFTFLILPPILAAVAVLAALRPALQAARLDPLITLREE